MMDVLFAVEMDGSPGIIQDLQVEEGSSKLATSEAKIDGEFFFLVLQNYITTYHISVN